MKKQYMAPAVSQLSIYSKYLFLAGSPTSTRNISGRPAENGLPTDIQTSSTVSNPVQDMFGNGQGYGTNRSREFDWDD